MVFNRKGKIPGTTGRRVPGSGRMPSMRGGFLTSVPFIKPEEGGSARFREYHRQQIRDARGQFAGGWGFAWVGLSALDQAAYDWAERQEKNVDRAIDELAEEMVAYMKENAPWTDRTPEERESSGDPPGQSAREELQASVVRAGDGTFTIYLGHGKDIYYGIWLEVRWGGRYAIIVPTAEQFAPQVIGKIGAKT